MLAEVSCDICCSRERTLLYDRDRTGAQVFNNICNQCGLVYVSPREDEQSIRERYQAGQFSLEARGSSIPSPEKFRQSEISALSRFRFLRSAVNLIEMSPGSILEIGCGVGSLLRLMKGMGWNTLGLEPDAEYARAGEQNYGITIRPEIYEEVTNLGQPFQMIAAFHVLEHLASPRAFLEKIVKSLDAGGILFLEVPCLERPCGGDLDRFFWSAHLYSFTRNTLSGLLQKTGFKIIKTEYEKDFLRILARKTPGPPQDPPVYPFDEPDLVIRRTFELQRRFLASSGRSRSAGSISTAPARLWFKLRYEPDDLKAALRRRIKKKAKDSAEAIRNMLFRGRAGNERFAHFGLHGQGNAGDTVLFTAVRRAIDVFTGPHEWSLEPLWQEVSEDTVKRLNENFSAIVVGGGGLFLKDTNPNSNSGWQWNISRERLSRIKVPLMVFAVGYNRFPGQDEFAPVFKPHLHELMKQSVFFGLRNHGSIREIEKYLDRDQIARVSFQPCPTTLLSRLYPAYRAPGSRPGQRRLALNIAFDRHRLRFGDNEDLILTRIAKAMKWAANQGWKIVLANHIPTDANVTPWLMRQGVDFEQIRLYDKTAKQVMDFYHKIPLTIGMRGHSQMVPFGLGNAIISLVSHSKLSYFLDDIGAPEWGLEIQDPELEPRLIELISRFDENRKAFHDRIQAAQDELWRITSQNLDTIRKALPGSGQGTGVGRNA